MKLGDRVRRQIHYGGEGGSLLPAEEGEVVYIHPEGRFYTVRFTFPDGYGGTRSFREAYPGEIYRAEADDTPPTDKRQRSAGHYASRGATDQDAPPARGKWVQYL